MNQPRPDELEAVETVRITDHNNYDPATMTIVATVTDFPARIKVTFMRQGVFIP